MLLTCSELINTLSILPIIVSPNVFVPWIVWSVSNFTQFPSVVDIVVAKFASLSKAVDNSFNVSKAPGAPLINFITSWSTYFSVANTAKLLEASDGNLNE